MYHGGGEILRGFTKNAFAFLNHSYIVAVLFLLLVIGSGLFPYYAALTGDPFAIATVVLISLVRVILFVNPRYRLDNALVGHPLLVAFWFVVFVRSSAAPPAHPPPRAHARRALRRARVLADGQTFVLGDVSVTFRRSRGSTLTLLRRTSRPPA